MMTISYQIENTNKETKIIQIIKNSEVEKHTNQNDSFTKEESVRKNQ